MNEKIIDFTMGADPEFSCLDQRKQIVVAADWVSDAYASEFGADGNGTTFELRPAPSKDPLQIVNNIHGIFVRKVIQEPEFLKFKWVSGSWHRGYPLGGHVHFGLKKGQIDRRSAVAFLDNYVGVVSLLLENKADAVKRRSGRYGHMGDFRPQKWGFEYRPMSSWISSPYVASAILCLSKTVMYEVMNNKKFQWHTFADSTEFNTVNRKKIMDKFQLIWKDITQMHLYQYYKPYIDLIYFIVTNNLTWLPSTNMKDCWGVVNMSPIISTKVGVDYIWNRYNMEEQEQQ